MKSIGLDTCVVVRLLVGTPIGQAEAALKYIENCYYDGISVYVSDIVVGEVFYALLYHYEIPEMEAVATLCKFLASSYIKTTGHALSVLEDYHGQGPGLMDRLIRMDYLNTVHSVVTLDKKMSRLSNVDIIKKHLNG